MKNKIGKSVVLILMVLAAILMSSCASITNKTIIGEQSGELWSDSDSYTNESVPALVKNQDEDFRILLFSDIQLESGFNDKESLELVDSMVNQVKPELIMTAGDNTAWIFAHKNAVKLITQMEAYGIPWAVTLGNHDSEGRADRAWHGNQYENAANSLFSSGPSNIQGIGNYSINIEDEKGKIIYTLVMLDSNIKRAYQKGTDYDYIYYDQIKWYKWLINGINSVENRVVPSMLFFHIPVPEYADAYNAWINNQIENPAAFGENREGVCCPPVNTGLFDTARELKSTTHMFCGHDHINNSSINWKGVRLTYGLKAGPTSYSDDDMHGATLITIKAVTNEVTIEHLFR